MPALDELFSLLDDRASLSDAEIEAAQHDLRQHAVGVRDGGIEVDDPVDTLSTIADYFEGCQYRIDSREESAQRRDADLESASQRLGLPALGTLTPPASHSPATRVQVGEPRIMRAHDFRDGEEMDALVEDFVGKLTYVHGQEFPAGMEQKIPLGRVRVPYPEDRQLHNDQLQASEYNKRIDALTAGAWMPERWQDESLVASGGFCAPAQPDYTQLVVAGTPGGSALSAPSIA